jgi:hypothetical protein
MQFSFKKQKVLLPFLPSTKGADTTRTRTPDIFAQPPDVDHKINDLLLL